MNSNPISLINVLIVWGVASAAGFVAMAVLMVLGDWTLLQGLFAAAIIFFALGTFLSFGFLKPLSAPVRPGTAGYAYGEPPKPKSAERVATPAPAKAAAGQPVAKAEAPAAPPAPAPAPEGEGARPVALDAPRGGAPDDLKKIKGIGPKLEQVVNGLGYYHYDQIANWSAEEVAWVDENLEGFKGRVTRDDWVSQARLLASGGETEFSKRVDEGDVY